MAVWVQFDGLSEGLDGFHRLGTLLTGSSFLPSCSESCVALLEQPEVARQSLQFHQYVPQVLQVLDVDH